MSEERYGSGSGEIQCYVVEARAMLQKPILLTDGMIVSADWRRIPLAKGPKGVRVELFNGMAESAGYLDFKAATALAWWFMANAIDASRPFGYRAIGIETRLVAVKFAYSYSATEVGVGPVLSGSRERDFVSQPRTESTTAGDAVARSGEQVTEGPRA